MVAGFARTKESESPEEKGPPAWVGIIGTVLTCKARRIQLRHVNGKAGIRANLQRTRRLRWYPSHWQLESCTGCRRIRSKSVSRGITRICAVTVTNIYWRWANRTENLPFGSAGLL